MKKLVFILQLMLLYSCTENGMTDIAQMDGNETIKFNVTVKDPITKSFITNEKEMAELGFFGYRYDRNETWPAAYTNAEQIMYNAQMNYSGSDNELWEYVGQPHYWGAATNSKCYSFFGIAPYNANYDATNAASPITIDENGFVLKYNAHDKQTTDLMVASSTDIYTPKDGVVTLNFEHALSALVFETDDYSKIKSVTITWNGKGNGHGIYVSGNVTVNSTPTWDLSSGTKEAKGSYTLYNDNGSSECMIIPQEVEADAFTIEIAYNNGTTADEFPIPAMTFEMGKCYTFKVKKDDSIFDVTEDPDGSYKMYIDLDDFPEYTDEGGNEQFIADQIEFLESKYPPAEVNATVVIKGQYETWDLLRYIMKNNSYANIDISEMGVGPNAFNYEIFRENKVIKNVVMPNILTSANMNNCNNLFEDCTSLESVTFPESVTFTMMPNSMCWNCDKLVSINIPTSVESIGYYTFDGCNSLDGYDTGTGLGIKFDETRTKSLMLYTGAFTSTLVAPEDMPVGYNTYAGNNNTFSLP